MQNMHYTIRSLDNQSTSLDNRKHIQEHTTKKNERVKQNKSLYMQLCNQSSKQIHTQKQAYKQTQTPKTNTQIRIHINGHTNTHT